MRRLLMQSIMWIILGGTVALAAVVSHYRRVALQVKLDNPRTYGGVTVQLPKGWELEQRKDELSSVLLAARESSGDADEDDEGDGGGARVIRVVRAYLPSDRSPLEFAGSRFSGGGRLVRIGETILIDGNPAAILQQTRQMTPKSIQELLAGGGQMEAKTICAAAMPPSGRGVAVELEGPGRVEPHDLELLRRIAESIKLSNEPPLTASGQIELSGGTVVQLPPDFVTAPQSDPLLLARILRGTKTDGPLRTISLVPAVFGSKDAGPTVLTMLSLYDSNNFLDAQARQEETVIWRVDVDSAISRNLPIRAYAVMHQGASLLAILRGGEDDAWMEGTWQALRKGMTLPAGNKTDKLVSAGAEAVTRLREGGVRKLLQGSQEEQWWLFCREGPQQPVGFWHYTPGATGGRFDNRFRFEHGLHKISDEWSGTPDLKTYSTRVEYTYSDLRDEQSAAKEQRRLLAKYEGGKVELTPQIGGGGGRAIRYSTPANYCPGGWLPLVMAGLSDQPVILRTDSFIDCLYANNIDLLTVVISPESPTTRPGGDESAGPLKCVSVEISGSGEKSRWYFRPDGTLDGIEYASNMRLIRREKNEISLDFAHNEPMRP